MKESNIQTSIKNRLSKHGWLVIKLIQTSVNGIHDQLALKDGKAVFIEAKQPGKQPTELQQFRHKQIEKLGFETIVATSINDIQHLCN